MTGNSIIQEALLLAQRIRNYGQTANADEIATAQIGLNNLLDEMNGLGAAVYSVAPITFTLTGVASYTIGTGGTINVPRPVKIEAWNVRTASGQAIGGKPLDAVEFATIAADRGASGSRAIALNYDGAFPLASAHLYPIPAAGGTLELWVWSQLAQITDFTLTVTYPPAYLQAIIYNLAVVIGPKFGKPIDPDIKAIADGAMAALATTNAAQHHAPPPSAVAPE